MAILIIWAANACQIFVNKIMWMYCGKQGLPSCQISVIAVLGGSWYRGCRVGWSLVQLVRHQAKLDMCEQSMAWLELGLYWIEGKKNNGAAAPEAGGCHDTLLVVEEWLWGIPTELLARLSRWAAIWLRAAHALDILGGWVGSNLAEGVVPLGD